MADKIKAEDFVEVEYTGKFKDGTIFDTTDEETAKKNNIFSPQMKYGQAIICVGEGQLVQGLDDSLIEKEIGKAYVIELTPEQAFGKKDFKKVKLISIAEFQKRNMNPQPGMQIDLDGEVGTIIRNSSGRVMVNFNHPFAGKEIVYEIKINKKITDPQKKINSYLELSLNIPDIKAEITEEKAAVTLPIELPKAFLEPLSEKLKKLTDLKEITFKTTPKQ